MYRSEGSFSHFVWYASTCNSCTHLSTPIKTGFFPSFSQAIFMMPSPHSLSVFFKFNCSMKSIQEFFSFYQAFLSMCGFFLYFLSSKFNTSFMSGISFPLLCSGASSFCIANCLSRNHLINSLTSCWYMGQIWYLRPIDVRFYSIHAGLLEISGNEYI